MGEQPPASPARYPTCLGGGRAGAGCGFVQRGTEPRSSLLRHAAVQRENTSENHSVGCFGKSHDFGNQVVVQKRNYFSAAIRRTPETSQL